METPQDESRSGMKAGAPLESLPDPAVASPPAVRGSTPWSRLREGPARSCVPEAARARDSRPSVAGSAGQGRWLDQEDRFSGFEYPHRLKLRGGARILGVPGIEHQGRGSRLGITAASRDSPLALPVPAGMVAARIKRGGICCWPRTFPGSPNQAAIQTDRARHPQQGSGEPNRGLGSGDVDALG